MTLLVQSVFKGEPICHAWLAPSMGKKLKWQQTKQNLFLKRSSQIDLTFICSTTNSISFIILFFFCIFFKLMILNRTSYHPTGAIRPINTLVQIILLRIWVGGFDLLDSLIMLCYSTLCLSHSKLFDQHSTSPWLTKIEHVTPNFQQLYKLVTRLGMNIFSKTWNPPEKLQDFCKLFLREGLEKHFSSQSQETGWNFESRTPVRITFF